MKKHKYQVTFQHHRSTHVYISLDAEKGNKSIEVIGSPNPSGDEILPIIRT